MQRVYLVVQAFVRQFAAFMQPLQQLESLVLISSDPNRTHKIPQLRNGSYSKSSTHNRCSAAF